VIPVDRKEYRFPDVCYGCYEYCHDCTRRQNGYSVSSIRELVATRLLKVSAIKRMERDIASIDKKLDEMNVGGISDGSSF